jgi:hypothetical protein
MSCSCGCKSRRCKSTKRGRRLIGKGIEEGLVKDIYNYQETNCRDDAGCKRRIRDYILKQPRITRTVYRGQTSSKTINPDTLFFSTSRDPNVAAGFTSASRPGAGGLAGGTCCLHEISVIDTQALDVNQVLGKESLMEEEQELLILGGGKFYKNMEMTEPGFLKLKSDYFSADHLYRPVEVYRSYYKA